IVRTTGGMGAYQRFSSDPRQVHAAIDHLQYSLMGRSRRVPFEPLSNDPEAMAAQARESMMTVGAIGSIRYVVEGLREMPGRKSVVLVSENLPLFIPPNHADFDSTNRPDTGSTVPGMAEVLDRVIDAANRASAVVYTIDPRGLRIGGLDPASAASESEAEFYAQNGLIYVAQKTGGLFLANNNDVSGLMQKALTDSSSYYLIGYHPDSATFSMAASEAFHRLS